MAHDLPLYTQPLPELQDHPLFSGATSVGIMSPDNPVAAGVGGADALRGLLKQQGLKWEETTGSYGAPERSFVVYGPTREHMYHLGKALGQEAVVFSHRGQHELLYTNGRHDGHFHPAHPAYGFHPKDAPPDYYTVLPGRGYLRLHFDSEKLHRAALRAPAEAALATPQAQPVSRQMALQGLARALRDAVTLAKAGAHPAHPHSYGWHEAHTAHHLASAPGGVLVPASFFHGRLAKDEAPLMGHPHTAAHGLPPAPKTPELTIDSAAPAGRSKQYGRFAAPYGTVDKASPSTLKFYPLEGKHTDAEAQLGHHGYQHYYAGGKFGKPDLLNRNYNTKHLMIYDPESGSSGTGDWETSYTDAWRKTHELAHALTYDQLNGIYGEGRRLGSLGKQRTTREALRAVHWEWLAAHKQRDLAAGLGVHVSDDDFHRELNTVMHDAVHRAVTGRFTDPQHEGFRPHSHKVPLETALGMVREAAAQMGLKGEHDLLQKSTSFVTPTPNPNLLDTRSVELMSDQATPNDVRLGLAKALKDALAQREAAITAARAKEASGEAKLAKTVPAVAAPPAAAEPAGVSCPECKTPGGRIGMTDGGRMVHYLCGLGHDFSVPGDHPGVTEHDLQDTDQFADADLQKAGHWCKGDECAHDMHKNAMSGYGPQVPGVKKGEKKVVLTSPSAGAKAGGVKDVVETGSPAHEDAKAKSTLTRWGLGKDELEASDASGCPACGGGTVEHLGDLGTRSHFLCKGCGMTFSHAAGADDLMPQTDADDPMAKEEIPQVEPATDEKNAKGAKMPDGSKELDAEGSGGDVSKGKSLKKDAMRATAPTVPATGRPKLPGMTKPLPRAVAPGTSPETAESLAAVQSLKNHPLRQQVDAATAPTVRGGQLTPPLAQLVQGAKGQQLQTPGGRAVPFVPKAAADDPGQPGAPASDAELQGDLKAAGVGFLRNLITKFRGVGNQSWQDLRGAGPASAARAARTTGTRMALAEKDENPIKTPCTKCGGEVKIVKRTKDETHFACAKGHKFEFVFESKTPSAPVKKDEKAPSEKEKALVAGGYVKDPKPAKPVKKTALPGTGKAAAPQAPKPPAASPPGKPTK